MDPMCKPTQGHITTLNPHTLTCATLYLVPTPSTPKSTRSRLSTSCPVVNCGTSRQVPPSALTTMHQSPCTSRQKQRPHHIVLKARPTTHEQAFEERCHVHARRKEAQ